ncbi:MAG: sulfite exporter TauE/SafE family protein [Gemmatimonadetes bacterium]|nr:sulfite exporter TauE/SafE family protein [Gemmatimonadota bacterium]
MTLALAVLAASLLGSVHCAAMCGAFACFYATSAGPRGGVRASGWSHAAYNGGRLVSYAALGALAGSLGGLIDEAGALAGVGRAAAIVAGVLMVAWGLHAVALARGARVPLPRVPDGWQKAMGAVLQRVRSRPAVARAAVMGLVTTLLPCGWLYAFVVTAGGAGSAAGGAAIMMVFWLGTLPVMLAVGAGAQRLAGPLRTRLPLVTAAAVTAMGVLSIALHLQLVPGAEALHRLTPGAPDVRAAAPPQ